MKTSLLGINIIYHLCLHEFTFSNITGTKLLILKCYINVNIYRNLQPNRRKNELNSDVTVFHAERRVRVCLCVCVIYLRSAWIHSQISAQMNIFMFPVVCLWRNGSHGGNRKWCFCFNRTRVGSLKVAL